MAQYKVKSTKYSFALHGGTTGMHYLGAWLPAGAIVRNVVLQKVTAAAATTKTLALYLTKDSTVTTGIQLFTGVTGGNPAYWATALTGIRIDNDKAILTIPRQLAINTNGAQTAGAYNILVEYIK